MRSLRSVTLPPSLSKRQDELDERLRAWLCRARRPLLAFSGGKDCQVILHAAGRLGLALPCATVRTAELEYPAHIAFVDRLKEAWDISLIVLTTKHTLKWLAAHREFLFPDTRTAAKFYQQVQQAHVRSWSHRYGADLVLFGRRTQGNCVPDWLYESQGIMQGFPVRDWKTEEIWAYLKAYQLPVSPLYGLPFADKLGVHTWNDRFAPPVESPWQVLFEHDPGIVKRAARYFPEARRLAEGSASTLEAAR